MTNNSKHWTKPEHQIQFDISIGKLLKSKRKSLGYTRSKFLNILSKFYNGEELISEDHYGRIERGERSISSYKLLLITNCLNSAIVIYNKKNNTNIKKITLDIYLELLENKLQG